MPATAADVWRAYIKPSMKGRLIIRKKTVNRKSSAVQNINRLFANAKFAAAARERCLAENKPFCIYTDTVYVPGQGYQQVKRCTFECFVRYLRLVAGERVGAWTGVRSRKSMAVAGGT